MRNLIILLSKLTTRAAPMKFDSPAQAIASKASQFLLAMDPGPWKNLHKRLLAEFHDIFGVDLRPLGESEGRNLVRAQLVHRQIKSAVDSAAAEALLVCIVAAQASFAGNYGVAAVAFNARGFPVAIGDNAMFKPRFDSQAHAEMIVMNKLERRVLFEDLPNCRVVTSLEPCPMCFTRLISSGVRTVRFLCADEAGGMVYIRDQLPPVWRKLFNSERDFSKSGEIPLYSTRPAINLGSASDPNQNVQTFAQLAQAIFENDRDKLDALLERAGQSQGVSKSIETVKK